MGLDMYINKEDGEELLYWRKQPAIHNWFQNLADDKKIEYESFNEVVVPLVKDDILKLRMDLNNQNLDFSTTGFFFGTNSNMEQADMKEWIKERLKECERMLTTIDSGTKISYNSWW